MEPARKKQKFNEIPREIINLILKFVRKSDLKSSLLVSKSFYKEISFLKRENTYLYVFQQNDSLKEILGTSREFNEIFFHGKQDPAHIDEILKKFGNKIKNLSFGKSDLNFMKVNSVDMIKWLKCTSYLTHLNTINIEIIPEDVKAVPFENLKVLRCCDSMLSFVSAPKLEKLKVFSTDSLSSKTLQSMNNFFKNHLSIKYLAYTIFTEDTDVQNCDFDLDQLKLSNLRFMGFRFDIPAVIKILKSQPNLIEARFDDGSYTETFEDITRVAAFQPFFDELLKLKKLEKLYIEMPSEDMMRKIPLYLENLKVLKVCSLTEEMLEIFQLISNDKIQKLCIENLEHGKKHLTCNHIKQLAKSYPNLTSFKADTLPAKVLNTISTHMTKLKKLKIIRNEYLPHKMKKSFTETVIMQPSNLERITCRFEDYKLRILPLIQVASNLKHLKCYWDNKNTPFMQIIFEIIMACPKIELIDFPFDGVYIKANVISFSDNFSFSYNNREFEVTISRKKGKIICRKIT